MKRVTALFLILAAGPVLYSQNFKSANTLLWRISGNGLARPSYLYGTMHLTDKRVFQFGDSVYKAIEQTDGFAAELDMARLGMQMINYVIAESRCLPHLLLLQALLHSLLPLTITKENE